MIGENLEHQRTIDAARVSPLKLHDLTELENRLDYREKEPTTPADDFGEDLLERDPPCTGLYPGDIISGIIGLKEILKYAAKFGRKIKDGLTPSYSLRIAI